MRKSAVRSPNLGLILNRPFFDIPPKGLRAGHNFRVKNGSLQSVNLGWAKFSDNWTLDGPVLLIDNFFPRNLPEQLIFADLRDIYLYHPDTDTVTYLTPVYTEGTARGEAPDTIIGSGTSWVDNVKVGDRVALEDTNDPNATWFTVTDVVSDTELTVAESVSTTSLDDYTIRQVFTGNRTHLWDFDVFLNDGESGDDLWIATNGIDPVVSWNGEDDTVTLHPELGFTCRTIVRYSNMMIYGGIITSSDFRPTSIINSDIGRPLIAGDVGAGLSEEFVVHGGSDEILNLIGMGDYLVIYSERNVTMAQFVGDPLVFIFRQALAGLGPIAKRAIADFGDYHEFIGPDAQYSFDGVSLNEINDHVWRDVVRTMDPLRRFQAFGHFDEEQGDLIWSTPLTTDASSGDIDGQAEIAYSEHYLEDIAQDDGTPHSRRDFPFTTSGFYERDEGITWDDLDLSWEEYNFAWNDKFFTLGFPQNLAGDVNGQIYILNENQRGDGEDLPSFVRFGRAATGDGRDRNLLTRVYPFARAFPSRDIDVTVFLGDNASGQLDRSETQTFDLDLMEDGHFVSIFRAGRFFEVQFSSDAGTPWILDGYDIEIRQGGFR